MDGIYLKKVEVAAPSGSSTIVMEEGKQEETSGKATP